MAVLIAVAIQDSVGSHQTQMKSGAMIACGANPVARSAQSRATRAHANTHAVLMAPLPALCAARRRP